MATRARYGIRIRSDYSSDLSFRTASPSREDVVSGIMDRMLFTQFSVRYPDRRSPPPFNHIIEGLQNGGIRFDRAITEADRQAYLRNARRHGFEDAFQTFLNTYTETYRQRPRAPEVAGGPHSQGTPDRTGSGGMRPDTADVIRQILDARGGRVPDALRRRLERDEPLRRDVTMHFIAATGGRDPERAISWLTRRLPHGENPDQGTVTRSLLAGDPQTLIHLRGMRGVRRNLEERLLAAPGRTLSFGLSS